MHCVEPLDSFFEEENVPQPATQDANPFPFNQVPPEHLFENEGDLFSFSIFLSLKGQVVCCETNIYLPIVIIIIG